LKRTVYRILLLAGALVYLGTLCVNLVGAWALHLPTLENLRRGLRWNPGNPLLWTGYARDWLYASGGSESQKAADAFLKAAAINPNDPENWDGLATAYMQMLESEKAEAAMRARLVATPYSPEGAWRLGNFLLVQGRLKEAFPYLRAAAASAPNLRLPLFDLAWKLLADPEAILRDLVPPGPDSRQEYLRFLLKREKLSEASEVWEEVRTGQSKEALNAGYAYVDALAAARMGREAAKVWDELLSDSGRASAKPAGELMTNGDFEASLPNAGLDWQLRPGPGYRIAPDDLVAQNGSRSLLVTFDGTANPNFGSVYETVPVDPNKNYRFSGYIKTDNITTDNGLRFSVSGWGAGPGESFDLSTANMVGTNPWTLQQLDFRTGPTTHIVLVVLRRPVSSKLNNLIQGKVWIDNLSLRTHSP
jgi:tetratricopeptide (TPR) repeat protein